MYYIIILFIHIYIYVHLEPAVPLFWFEGCIYGLLKFIHAKVHPFVQNAVCNFFWVNHDSLSNRFPSSLACASCSEWTRRRDASSHGSRAKTPFSVVDVPWLGFKNCASVLKPEQGVQRKFPLQYKHVFIRHTACWGSVRFSVKFPRLPYSYLLYSALLDFPLCFCLLFYTLLYSSLVCSSLLHSSLLFCALLSFSLFYSAFLHASLLCFRLLISVQLFSTLSSLLFLFLFWLLHKKWATQSFSLTRSLITWVHACAHIPAIFRWSFENISTNVVEANLIADTASQWVKWLANRCQIWSDGHRVKRRKQLRQERRSPQAPAVVVLGP